MKKTVVGILAHVDAGKTTLAEALLYRCGAFRNMGSVNNRDSHFDTDEQEKSRGITIFSSEARITYKDTGITLVDTPGHIDFSAETERILGILDYAILVISSIEGVQSHTVTLMKLLDLYSVPYFIFVTKMDYGRCDKEKITGDLKKYSSAEIIDFTDSDKSHFNEKIALCSDSLLEKYLSGDEITDTDKAKAIKDRKLVPLFFGSGLKSEGVDILLDAVSGLTVEKSYPECFGAKVYKVSYDGEQRITYLKVTGGQLKVRDSVTYGEGSEKINSIRIYNGVKYETADSVSAGELCAVTGLNNSFCGLGYGIESCRSAPVMEPVMNYRINIPDDLDINKFLPMLRKIEEEEPLLNVSVNSFTGIIHVNLMGEIQSEILKNIIDERFGISVTFDKASVQYKETIADSVEGVGHYEPLRHYAEVHLLISPAERGSGITIKSDCSEDFLDRNWQRLILTHLKEKTHIGVLSGSPLTDVVITLKTGRAHLKHTEGGDFRQATYRAVRQGLMKARSVILEPYYSFKLIIPSENIGRAINDIHGKSGSFSSPETFGEYSELSGFVPVSEFSDYASVVASYTGGRGKLITEYAGYRECHNPDEIITLFDYNPEADIENTPDSVFCAHGAGFNVKWNEVENYMHLSSCTEKSKDDISVYSSRNFRIEDKELEQIMEKEFGKVKYELYRSKPESNKSSESKTVELNVRKQYYIIDGYNLINAWDKTAELAVNDFASAREYLMEKLCNFSSFTGINIVLVFDAYKVSGNTGEKFNFYNISVVYTKERESGDVYIEQLIAEIGKNEKLTVITSDSMIQYSTIRAGVMRKSSREFAEELKKTDYEIEEYLSSINRKNVRMSFGEKLKLLQRK